MPDTVRVRFAPSPTGYLHIGNVHTALFTWLFARHAGGGFVLRIEDTDVERSSAEYEAGILRDLAWLGLDWDESVDVGGPYGPYRQTQRGAIYHEFAERLLAAGLAYPCYCTKDEVDACRAESLAKGEPPRYSGRCRDLTPPERDRLAAEGRVPVIRFKTPPSRSIVVHDLIRGDIVFNTDDLDDFVIVRSNGVPLYNFAVTVDDLTMRVSHIIRADEHIANTPRQILLYEAFHATPPVFAHVAMLLGSDRTKLSKRHGASSLAEYREAGYLPEAVLNYLATLGWAPESGEEVLSREEITRQFDIRRVSRSAAVFDPDKLRWLNGVYIRNADLDRLTELALPYLKAAGHLPEVLTPGELDWTRNLIGVVRGHLDHLGAIADETALFFEKEVDLEPEALKLMRQEHVKDVLAAAHRLLAGLPDSEFLPERLHSLLHVLPAELGLGVGKALRPLRAALTGRQSGPELANIVWLFGKEKALARLQEALISY